MSATDPAGKLNKKSGKLAAVCISATRIAEFVSDVITQEPPVFCIHDPTLETTDAKKIALNTGFANGSHASAILLIMVLFFIGTNTRYDNTTYREFLKTDNYLFLQDAEK